MHLKGVITVAWLKSQCSSESDDQKFYEHNVTLAEHQQHSFEQQQHNCVDRQNGFPPTSLLSLNPSPDLMVEKENIILPNHVQCGHPLSDIILSSMSNGGRASSSTATASDSLANSDSGTYYYTMYF
jgi:hypothetical protein